MKRNGSLSAENSTDGEAEEMKELFSIEEFKVQENDPIKKCRCMCHLSNTSDNNESDGSPSSDAKIQIEDAAFRNAGHVMTRRITIAGGFLDIALFTTNCEQLKFVLELGEFHIYYNQVFALLITSLVLQLLVGLTMFLLGCHVHHKESDQRYSNFLNHATMGLVALITIVNIFIGTFGPKGTVMARCLGAFAYPNSSGPIWNAYLNFTRTYMADEPIWNAYQNFTRHYMSNDI